MPNLRPLVCAVLAAALLGADAPAAKAPSVAEDAAAAVRVTAANAAFRAGDFAAARAAYRALAAEQQPTIDILERAGFAALYDNDLTEAQRWYESVVARDGANVTAHRQLAEIARRRDDFDLAAREFEFAGSSPQAAWMRAGARPAYAMTPPATPVSIPFVVTDPLPIVHASVNGKDGIFIIDTGGPELTLTSSFATSAGVSPVATTSGTFAGGQPAALPLGWIDLLGLGNVTIRNVPVKIVNLGETTASGVIGTVLLSHFRSTIDYPHARLVLEPRGLPPRGANRARFWFAGDHYLFARGRVNDSPPLQLLVDTGLAGGGYLASPLGLLRGNIHLDQSGSRTAQGPGGPVTVTPFRLDTLALGDLNARDVPGVDVPGTFEALQFPFDVGGIISHAFFKPHALTLDFDAMMLAFDAAP